MPAQLVYDGQDDYLLEHISALSQKLGGYTAKDYAEVLDFLIGRWKIDKLTGLCSEGRRAQDFVCGLPPKIKRLEEWAQGKANQASTIPFSWIFGREIII